MKTVGFPARPKRGFASASNYPRRHVAGFGNPFKLTMPAPVRNKLKRNAGSCWPADAPLKARQIAKWKKELDRYFRR